MMDLSTLMKMKGMFETFNKNHPRFIPFVQAAGRDAMMEGTVIDIKVTSPDGKEYNTNMKITQSDLELFESIQNISR